MKNNNQYKYVLKFGFIYKSSFIYISQKNSDQVQF